MQTPSGAEITFDGDVVVKLHRAGTDPRALRTRLRVADALPDILLAPSTVAPERVGERWRSRWPCVQTIAPQPAQLPWADAGGVLARLHAQPVTARLLHGWPARLRRVVEHARRTEVTQSVRRALTELPPAVWRAGSPDRPRTFVHGDFHLGQLGRRGPGRPWLLIDVDDLGVGDPAWDLARPAGFWAAGHLPDEDWSTFLEAYRQGGGAALADAPADPWPVLDPFARAAVVAAAVHHPEDELLAAACARMV
ncbi:phosphotransferase family protein [Mycolicibacterium doricum]|uniref:Aminoglycoside phosphotransferase n=1 Tax=Mycolicibacterium doricum TaxID=126673 RepID=A0A1X1T2P8_9MYCO|nr:aminoglycoside phosphotransferase family protein [Mycolicibacterium doricum]MCV7270121.1 aminoglycoside phosphotransferase family protein [Mycolicibacterium doricum]ORV38522.1 aminoglycoside phosphotransferase [Mycolicibacterium doricum]